MTREKTSAAEEEGDDGDVRCGYGTCKPDCLQVFNNPKFMLFVLCFLVTVQGMCFYLYRNLEVNVSFVNYMYPSAICD